MNNYQNQNQNQKEEKALDKYAINLCEKARAGKLDPVIGRDDEIRRVLQILSRRNTRRTTKKAKSLTLSTLECCVFRLKEELYKISIGKRRYNSMVTHLLWVARQEL